MPNVENILRVADAIESRAFADALGFNMSDFLSRSADDMSGHGCGTTACIGGWANAVRNKAVGADGVMWDNVAAQRFLGIDDLTSGNLFFAYNFPEELRGERWFERIGSAKAVAVLRHLADTGEVDWSVEAKAR